MIRDENKRMHTPGWSFLRISKLEKRGAWYRKEESKRWVDVINDAIEHVNLILEEKGNQYKSF
jgi:two-component system phosphate regulon sensor histidine kinase PhoR